MQNYYITENNEEIEIIDKNIIDLSGCNFATSCNFATNKKIKEIHITSLTKCIELYLDNNCLTTFKTNLPNCNFLFLSRNNLTVFKADLINYLFLHNNNLSYKRISNKSTFNI